MRLGQTSVLLLFVTCVFARQTSAPASPTGQLAPAAVGQDRECLECHEQTAATLKKRFTHAATSMGCMVCHANHRTAAETGPKSPYLISPEPALCTKCHD